MRIVASRAIRAREIISFVPGSKLRVLRVAIEAQLWNRLGENPCLLRAVRIMAFHAILAHHRSMLHRLLQPLCDRRMTTLAQRTLRLHQLIPEIRRMRIVARQALAVCRRLMFACQMIQSLEILMATQTQFADLALQQRCVA